MTSFTKDQLPNSINTVEEVLAWSASILAELNAEQLIQIDRSNKIMVCDTRPALVTTEAVDPERFAVSAYLPLQPDWRTKKAWMNGVKELSTDAIPTVYTVNT